MVALMMNVSCRKDVTEEPEEEVVPVDTSYISNLTDTYYDVYSFDKVYEWGPYNVHDPSILNDGDYF